MHNENHSLNCDSEETNATVEMPLSGKASGALESTRVPALIERKMFSDQEIQIITECCSEIINS